LSWFEKLGIKILVAYGMTEDCCYNHIGKARGIPAGFCRKSIARLAINNIREGEIRDKKCGNMVGYYNQPELTAEALMKRAT
jgi:long-subunit acyl-CoA synthetase (AMP-forming)